MFAAMVGFIMAGHDLVVFEWLEVLLLTMMVLFQLCICEYAIKIGCWDVNVVVNSALSRGGIALLDCVCNRAILVGHHLIVGFHYGGALLDCVRMDWVLLLAMMVLLRLYIWNVYVAVNSDLGGASWYHVCSHDVFDAAQPKQHVDFCIRVANVDWVLLRQILRFEAMANVSSFFDRPP
nr:hypothetical protein [Tanacetum cinerariifolium]